jgi:arabinoxylan arabinofuranohydrolase
MELSNKALKNPIIPGRGVCDPHIHVFNDCAYLYASHDLSPQNELWHMEDWQIWSSADLVNWKLESTLRPEDLYMGASHECWAVDAATRNGKYFLYFSDGNQRTGVAVSDAPGGPFTDALGKPLLDGTLTTTTEYDPAVFVDDDGSAHILFGGPTWAYGPGAGYYMAELGDDMTSIKSEPRLIEVNHDADDKASLHKHNSIYYLTWASFYATSTNLYGPYNFRGNFGASPDHGSFFSFNGQDFNAFTIFDPHFVHRATGITYIHYRDNGEIATDGLIVEMGVGQYDAQWNKIEAEWFMAAHNCVKRENPRLGFDMTDLQDGSYLYYPKIRNVPKNALIHFYASPKVETKIEIRSGGIDGPLLGTAEMAPGFMAWKGYKSFTAQLENAAGELDIYLVFRGAGKSLIDLDWFSFAKA